jgi:hypothetical protein
MLAFWMAKAASFRRKEFNTENSAEEKAGQAKA